MIRYIPIIIWLLIGCGTSDSMINKKSKSSEKQAISNSNDKNEKIKDPSEKTPPETKDPSVPSGNKNGIYLDFGSEVFVKIPDSVKFSTGKVVHE